MEFSSPVTNITLEVYLKSTHTPTLNVKVKVMYFSMYPLLSSQRRVFVGNVEFSFIVSDSERTFTFRVMYLCMITVHNGFLVFKDLYYLFRIFPL